MQVSGWQHVTRGIGFTLVSLFCVAGCTPHQVGDDIVEYADRLARVLDAELTADNEVPLYTYPERESLLAAPAPLEINLTRFYQLQQCELGNLVAERNTALGKIQHFSQRLQYEQRLLRALQDCMAYVGTKADESERELLITMRSWLAAKQASYPAYWSNMLTLSDETHAAFSRPLANLLAADTLDIAGQFSLFQQLDSYSSTTNRVETNAVANLEDVLQSIGATRLPASIWQAQHQIAVQLPALTKQLDPLLANIACPDGNATEQAHILRNVFYLFFVQRIQPLGSHINDFNYKFLALLTKWRNDDNLPKPFKQYLALQQNTNVRYQQAMQAHVTLWQRFLGRCDLSPTAP